MKRPAPEVPLAPRTFERRSAGATSTPWCFAARLLDTIRKSAAAGACLGVLLGGVAGTAPASGALLTELRIEGTDRDDEIEISRNGDRVRVTINGSSRDLTAAELRGGLTILGLGGNDHIRVGPNLENIDIQIDGGDGDDRIIGGDGPEILVGGKGDDEIWGNGGRDLILGGAGNDRLYGGEGIDLIIGREGDDLLDGGAGDDFLDGGRGEDKLLGGAGKDTIVSGRGVDDVVADASDVVMGEPIGDAGKTIEIRGTDDFRAEVENALDVLRSTESGRKLLETIDASDHRVVIQYGAGDGEASGLDEDLAILKKNGKRNTGTDVTISWDPRFADSPDDIMMFEPPAIVLGHELVHAFNLVTGTLPDEADSDDEGEVPADEALAIGLKFDHDGDPRTPKVTPEEYYRRLGLPLVSENTLRNELGLMLRTKY